MCLTNEHGNWVYLSKPILSCSIMGMTLFTTENRSLPENHYIRKTIQRKLFAISSISLPSAQCCTGFFQFMFGSEYKAIILTTIHWNNFLEDKDYLEKSIHSESPFVRLDSLFK